MTNEDPKYSFDTDLAIARELMEVELEMLGSSETLIGDLRAMNRSLRSYCDASASTIERMNDENLDLRDKIGAARSICFVCALTIAVLAAILLFRS